MYRIEILQTKGDGAGLFMQGRARRLPVLNESLQIRESGYGLVLETTPVLAIEEHASHLFLDTANSSYVLRVLSYEDDEVIVDARAG